MKLRELLEAKYAFRQDSKCHVCGNEFNFSDEAEETFFKDFAVCPNCGAENERDHAWRRKQAADRNKSEQTSWEDQ